jgi:hypothetical protein
MTSDTDYPTDPNSDDPGTGPSAPDAPTKPDDVNPDTGTDEDDIPIDNPSG